MDVRLTVAVNLRRLRVAKNMSQDDLALVAGVERAYVGHMERGGKNPTIVTLAKLAAALECGLSEFFAPVNENKLPVAPLPGGRRKK